MRVVGTDNQMPVKLFWDLVFVAQLLRDPQFQPHRMDAFDIVPAIILLTEWANLSLVLVLVYNLATRHALRLPLKQIPQVPIRNPIALLLDVNLVVVSPNLEDVLAAKLVEVTLDASDIRSVVVPVFQARQSEIPMIDKDIILFDVVVRLLNDAGVHCGNVGVWAIIILDDVDMVAVPVR